MKNFPQPEGQNANLNFEAQIAKARQDLHDAEALAYSLEKGHAETLGKLNWKPPS